MNSNERKKAIKSIQSHTQRLESSANFPKRFQDLQVLSNRLAKSVEDDVTSFFNASDSKYTKKEKEKIMQQIAQDGWGVAYNAIINGYAQFFRDLNHKLITDKEALKKKQQELDVKILKISDQNGQTAEKQLNEIAALRQPIEKAAQEYVQIERIVRSLLSGRVILFSGLDENNRITFSDPDSHLEIAPLEATLINYAKDVEKMTHDYKAAIELVKRQEQPSHKTKHGKSYESSHDIQDLDAAMKNLNSLLEKNEPNNELFYDIQDLDTAMKNLNLYWGKSEPNQTEVKSVSANTKTLVKELALIQSRVNNLSSNKKNLQKRFEVLQKINTDFVKKYGSEKQEYAKEESENIKNTQEAISNAYHEFFEDLNVYYEKAVNDLEKQRNKLNSEKTDRSDYTLEKQFNTIVPFNQPIEQGKEKLLNGLKILNTVLTKEVAGFSKVNNDQMHFLNKETKQAINNLQKTLKNYADGLEKITTDYQNAIEEIKYEVKSPNRIKKQMNTVGLDQQAVDVATNKLQSLIASNNEINKRLDNITVIQNSGKVEKETPTLLPNDDKFNKHYKTAEVDRIEEKLKRLEEKFYDSSHPDNLEALNIILQDLSKIKLNEKALEPVFKQAEDLQNKIIKSFISKCEEYNDFLLHNEKNENNSSKEKIKEMKKEIEKFKKMELHLEAPSNLLIALDKSIEKTHSLLNNRNLSKNLNQYEKQLEVLHGDYKNISLKDALIKCQDIQDYYEKKIQPQTRFADESNRRAIAKLNREFDKLADNIIEQQIQNFKAYNHFLKNEKLSLTDIAEQSKKQINKIGQELNELAEFSSHMSGDALAALNPAKAEHLIALINQCKENFVHINALIEERENTDKLQNENRAKAIIPAHLQKSPPTSLSSSMAPMEPNEPSSPKEPNESPSDDLSLFIQIHKEVKLIQKEKLPIAHRSFVTRLEQSLDKWNEKLSTLPEGSLRIQRQKNAGAALHDLQATIMAMRKNIRSPSLLGDKLDELSKKINTQFKTPQRGQNFKNY